MPFPINLAVLANGLYDSLYYYSLQAVIKHRLKVEQFFYIRASPVQIDRNYPDVLQVYARDLRSRSCFASFIAVNGIISISNCIFQDRPRCLSRVRYE